MIRGITFLLALFVSTICVSHELKGSWGVDVDATVRYNSSNKGMNELKMSLLRCLTSNTKMVIGDKLVTEIIIPHTCTHGDKSGHIEGYENTYSYETLYSSEKQTVMLNSNDLENEYVDVINWIDENTFWIDLPEKDFRLRRSRYFFSRDVQGQSKNPPGNSKLR